MICTYRFRSVCPYVILINSYKESTLIAIVPILFNPIVHTNNLLRCFECYFYEFPVMSNEATTDNKVMEQFFSLTIRIELLPDISPSGKLRIQSFFLNKESRSFSVCASKV